MSNTQLEIAKEVSQKCYQIVLPDGLSTLQLALLLLSICCASQRIL